VTDSPDLQGPPGWRHPSISTVPHADPTSAAAVAELEHGLRDSRERSTAALLVGTALLRVGAAGVGVAVQFYLADLAHGRPHAFTIGIIGAAQALTEMLFAPILARFADKRGRKLFLVGGPVLGFLGVLLTAGSVHPQQIFVARLLEGLSAAAFVPTALGAVAAASSQSIRFRARASGAFEAATLAGYAGGFAVGPFAYHYLGRGAFLVLAGAYLAGGLVCLRFVAHVPPLPVSKLSTVIRAIIGPGPIRSFLPAWIGSFALLGAYAANFAALLHRSPVVGQTLVRHVDTRVVAIILVSWILVLVIGILLWVSWIPRLGPAAQMRRAVPGGWVFSASLLVADHLPLGDVLYLLPFTALGTLWVSGFGPAAIAYMAACSETYAADRSALMSGYSVALAAGGAIGALLGGVAVSLDHLDGLVVLGMLITGFTFLVLLGPIAAYERAMAGTGRRTAEPVP
jgi:predicted MFS family arabinose efflux permease